MIAHQRPAMLVAMLCIFSASAVFAKPVVLAVHGGLRTASGAPVSDGDYALSLALYADKAGGQPVYLENLAVKVKGSAFHVELGSADPFKKLDDALFIAGKAGWLGVRVGVEPELTRVPLRYVPYAALAHSAQSLTCSGCVAGAAIATGAISAQHVAFTWAGSATKGGPATKALLATKAEQATLAGKALVADSAAKAAEAATLKCTGCVKASHLDKTVVADLIAAGQLAKVAASGKYADLQGAPDLAPYARVDKSNTFKAQQNLAAPLNFAKQQALLFRFQNAAKAPAPCDAAAVGLAWYDTSDQTLKLCNGKDFVIFAKAMALGSKGMPADSCKALKAADATLKSGKYWLSAGGKTFETWCDMTTAGGGWTLAATVANSDAMNWTHSSGNWESKAPFGAPSPTSNADFKSQAFGSLGANEILITWKNKLLLRTQNCLAGKNLADRFAELKWTCGGSASFANHPACTHPCTLAESKPDGAEKVLTEGKSISRLYLKAGEVDGAQDTNKDRSYLSTSIRTNVDWPLGLGAFCSGGCAGKPGQLDMAVRHDGVLNTTKDHWYGIWVR